MEEPPIRRAAGRERRARVAAGSEERGAQRRLAPGTPRAEVGEVGRGTRHGPGGEPTAPEGQSVAPPAPPSHSARNAGQAVGSAIVLSRQKALQKPKVRPPSAMKCATGSPE